MTKRISNPEKGEKLEKYVTFGLTRKLYSIIERKAAKEGVKIGRFIREKALSGWVKPKWTSEEREIVDRLAGMRPGILQLAERAKTEDIEIIAQEFKVYGEQMDMIVEQLRKTK